MLLIQQHYKNKLNFILKASSSNYVHCSLEIPLPREDEKDLLRPLKFEVWGSGDLHPIAHIFLSSKKNPQHFEIHIFKNVFSNLFS